MARSVNVYTETKTLTDRESGEVIKHESNVVNLRPEIKEPPYVKMYINDLCTLINVPEAQKSLLLTMLKKLDYEGYITLSTRFRKLMCEELGIKDQTLRNRIGLLLKTNLLIRVSTNEFMANPDYFAVGKWEDICANKLNFEMVVKYNSNGKRTIKTVVTEQQQELPLENNS